MTETQELKQKHWNTEPGKHELILEEGEYAINLTRTGHYHHGPARFIYTVYEDGGIDITQEE